MRRIIGCLIALSTFSSGQVMAQDDDKWWFDVEVVLFSRSAAVGDLSESFEQQSRLTAPKTDWDLLSQYFQPDLQWVYSSLPVCEKPESPLWAEAPDLEEIIAKYYVPEPESEFNQSVDGYSAEAVDTVEDTSDTFEESALVNEQDTTDPLLSVDPTMSDTVPDAEEVIIPPSPETIASYWVESHVGDIIYKEAMPAKRDFSCVAQQGPAFVTNTPQWHWQAPNLHVPFPDQTPLNIHGADWARANGPHLLSEEQLTQQDLFTSVRWRKGINRLAHFSWRQQVKFGQDNAETLRLFAGQNFAEQFTVEGELRPEPIEGLLDSPDSMNSGSDSAYIDPDAVKAEKTAAFFNELNTRLAQPQPISYAAMTAPQDENTGLNIDPYNTQLPPIWELDGFIQVFLKYINRVPYLHINSELFYRQPIATGVTQQSNSTNAPTYELVSIPFRQVRRVISTQLHYFDHPLFGMVVQIRRYDRPAAEKSNTDETQ